MAEVAAIDMLNQRAETERLLVSVPEKLLDLWKRASRDERRVFLTAVSEMEFGGTDRIHNNLFYVRP